MSLAAFLIGRSGSEAADLIVELLISTVDAAIDRISLDMHGLFRHAEDVRNAAVFFSLLLCAELWTSASRKRVSASISRLAPWR